MRDDSGDETDGLNETLCPCDFKQVRITLLACALALSWHTYCRTPLSALQDHSWPQVSRACRPVRQVQCIVRMGVTLSL